MTTITGQSKQQSNKAYPKRNGWYYSELNGKEVIYPSITGILGMAPKPFLMPWMGKQCAEIALDNPTLTVEEVMDKQKVSQKATCDRGKNIHNIAPQMLNNKPYVEVEKFKGYIDGLKKFVAENKPVELFNEKTVVSHKYGIGGTADWGLLINDKRYLVDIKTGKAIYDTYPLQLGFYEEALKESGDEYDDMMVLLLRGKGNYVFESVKDRKNMKTVMAMKHIFEWNKEVNK